jgi:menaquinone-9 beta-reductase
MHFFRGDGLVRSLAEVGVLDEVLAAGVPPLRCEYFAVDDGPAELGPPQDPGEIGYCGYEFATRFAPDIRAMLS